MQLCFRHVRSVKKWPDFSHSASRSLEGRRALRGPERQHGRAQDGGGGRDGRGGRLPRLRHFHHPRDPQQEDLGGARGVPRAGEAPRGAEEGE